MIIFYNPFSCVLWSSFFLRLCFLSLLPSKRDPLFILPFFYYSMLSFFNAPPHCLINSAITSHYTFSFLPPKSPSCFHYFFSLSPLLTFLSPYIPHDSFYPSPFKTLPSSFHSPSSYFHPKSAPYFIPCTDCSWEYSSPSYFSYVHFDYVPANTRAAYKHPETQFFEKRITRQSPFRRPVEFRK